MSETNVPLGGYSLDDEKDETALVVGDSKEIIVEEMTEELEFKLDSGISCTSGDERYRKTDVEVGLVDSSDKNVTFGLANFKIDSDASLDENTDRACHISTSSTDLSIKQDSTEEKGYPMKDLPSITIDHVRNIEMKIEENRTGSKKYEVEISECTEAENTEFKNVAHLSEMHTDESLDEAEKTYFIVDVSEKTIVVDEEVNVSRQNDDSDKDIKAVTDEKVVILQQNDPSDDDNEAVFDEKDIHFRQHDPLKVDEYSLPDEKAIDFEQNDQTDGDKVVTDEKVVVLRQNDSSDDDNEDVSDEKDIHFRQNDPSEDNENYFPEEKAIDFGPNDQPDGDEVVADEEDIVAIHDEQSNDDAKSGNLKSKKRKLTPRKINRMKKLLLRKLHSNGDKDFYIGDLLEAVESELMDLPKVRTRQRSNKPDIRTKPLTKKKIRSINTQRRKNIQNMQVLATSMSEEFVGMDAFLDTLRQVSTDFKAEFMQPNTPIGEPHSADLRMKELFLKTKERLPMLQDSFKEVKHCMRMYVKTDRTLTDDLHNAVQTYFEGSGLKAKHIPRVRYSEVLKILKNSNRQHCDF